MYELETGDTGPGTPANGPSPSPGGSRHKRWREHARLFLRALTGTWAPALREPRAARMPSSAVVSNKLLRRRRFLRQAGLNTLATAWIHFYRYYTSADGAAATTLCPAGAAMRRQWVGPALLQALFAREHARVSERLQSVFPHLDAVAVNSSASLVTDRLIASIHRREWHEAVAPGAGRHLARRCPHALFSPRFSAACAARDFEPPLPDDLQVCSAMTGDPLATCSTLLAAARNDHSAIDLWYSLGVTCTGRFTLGNRALGMRRGFDRDGVFTDLAADELQATRDSPVRTYNTLRRELGLRPLAGFHQLDGDWAQVLGALYLDIDLVDRAIGLLAERHLPGCAAGVTTLCCLNAERRLHGTRNAGFDVPATLESFARRWTADTSLRELLLQHYPVLQDALYRIENPFVPWRVVELIV